MIWKHLDHYDADGFPRDNSKFKENWSHIIDSSSPGSGNVRKIISHTLFFILSAPATAATIRGFKRIFPPASFLLQDLWRMMFLPNIFSIDLFIYTRPSV